MVQLQVQIQSDAHEGTQRGQAWTSDASGLELVLSEAQRPPVTGSPEDTELATADRTALRKNDRERQLERWGAPRRSRWPTGWFYPHPTHLP